MDGIINFFVAILLDLSLHTSHDLKALLYMCTVLSAHCFRHINV